MIKKLSSRFKPSPTGQILYWTFMTISQSIDASSKSGLFEELRVDEKEIWALYLQTLTPFYTNDNDMDITVLQLLIATCPYASELKKYNFSLNVEAKDEKIYTDCIKLVKGKLNKEFSNIKVINDETFLQECGSALEDFVNRVYPDKFDSETRALIFTLSLAVRSMIKDTINLGTSERTQRRDTGFFWVAMILIAKFFFVYSREED